MISPPSSDASGFDNYVVGAMIIAFVIFITARGELSTYLQLFFYVPPVSTVSATSAAAVSNAGTGVNSTGSVSVSDMTALQQAATQAAALAKSGVVTP